MEQTKEKNRKVKYIVIIVVAVIIYLLNFTLNRQKIFLNTDSDTEVGCTDILINGKYVEQYFYTNHDFEMAVQICVITWNTVYDSNDLLMISIVDRETGEVMRTTEYGARSFTDHLLSKFMIFEGTVLEADHWYGIRIESNITDENKPIAIACVENINPEMTNVICNGEPVDYNLRLKICE